MQSTEYLVLPRPSLEPVGWLEQTAATAAVGPRAGLDTGRFCQRRVETKRSSANDRRPQFVAWKWIVQDRPLALHADGARRALPKRDIAATCPGRDCDHGQDELS